MVRAIVPTGNRMPAAHVSHKPACRTQYRQEGSIRSEWCGRRLTARRCVILSGKAGGAKPAALERRIATAPERRQGTQGSRDARRLVAGPTGPKGGKPEGNRPQRRHRGCVPYRLHGPGECGSQGPVIPNAHTIRREGWPSGRIRVQGLEGSWPLSRWGEPGAGFQGRHTPLVKRVQERAKSPPGRGPSAKRSVWVGFGRGRNAPS